MHASKLSLLTTTALVAVACSVASAQENGDPFDLGQIVLKGELQQRTQFDSPTSSAVETGEALEKRGDVDVYDVIERTPNVTAGFGEKGFVIRGIDQRGNAGNGLAITTQVDGVALPSNQATFFGPYSTWDIDQVEVLRGPQSTQQGRNALAGAVIIRTNDPTFERELKFHAEAGSRGHNRFALMANTPLVEDKLAFRFAAEYNENDGYVTNPTLGIDDYDGREATSYRAKLLWNATDDVEVILSYAYNESSGGEDGVELAPYPGSIVNLSDVRGREGSEHNNFGLRINWTLNNALTLESETNYYTHDYWRQEDFDNTPGNFGILSATGDSTVFEQDVRLRFDTGRVQGVVGLFYSEIEDQRPSFLTVDTGIALGGAPNGLFVSRNETFPSDTTNIAVYGEADIAADEWLNGLSFTVGARYDYEEFSFSQSQTFQPFVPPGFANSSFSGSTTYEAFLPKLGATYDFAENQAISFTVQRGYRSGGAQVNIVSGALNQFDPEFTTNYELAYRGSFYDDALRVSANAFFTQWEDQQISVPGPSGNQFDTNVVNAGESEVWGGELVIEGEPTANLSLFGSLGYANTKFTDFVINAGLPNQEVLDGNQFAGAPEWTVALGGSYAWDNGLTLAVDASYTGASFADDRNTLRNDDRWLVNTQLTYEHEDNWIAGLYVRNLLDEDYVVQVFNGGTRGRVGEPRTVGAFLTKSF